MHFCSSNLIRTMQDRRWVTDQIALTFTVVAFAPNPLRNGACVEEREAIEKEKERSQAQTHLACVLFTFFLSLLRILGIEV